MKNIVLFGITLFVSTTSLAMEDYRFGGGDLYQRQQRLPELRVAERAPMRIYPQDLSPRTTFEEVISAVACDIADVKFGHAIDLLKVFVSPSRHENDYLQNWLTSLLLKQQWVALPLFNTLPQDGVALLGKQHPSDHESIPEIIAQVAYWYAVQDSDVGKRYLNEIMQRDNWDDQSTYAMTWLEALETAREAWVVPPRIPLEMWGVPLQVEQPRQDFRQAEVLPILDTLDPYVRKELATITKNFEKKQTVTMGSGRLVTLLKSSALKPNDRAFILQEARKAIKGYIIDDQGLLKPYDEKSASSTKQLAPSSASPNLSYPIYNGGRPPQMPEQKFVLPTYGQRSDASQAASLPHSQLSPILLPKREEKLGGPQQMSPNPQGLGGLHTLHQTVSLVAPQQPVSLATPKQPEKVIYVKRGFRPDDGQVRIAGEEMTNLRKENKGHTQDDAERRLMNRLGLNKEKAQILLGNMLLGSGRSLGIYEYADQVDEDSGDEEDPDKL